MECGVFKSRGPTGAREPPRAPPCPTFPRSEMCRICAPWLSVSGCEDPAQPGLGRGRHPQTPHLTSGLRTPSDPRSREQAAAGPSLPPPSPLSVQTSRGRRYHVSNLEGASHCLLLHSSAAFGSMACYGSTAHAAAGAAQYSDTIPQFPRVWPVQAQSRPHANSSELAVQWTRK